MSVGKYSALSGAITQQRRLEVVSNNLANLSTAGFKADRALFQVEQTPLPNQDILYGSEPGTLSANAIEGPYQCSFSVCSGTMSDASQGVVRVTDNPLDVAIEGDGYFSVRGPSGELYTRNGSFQVDSRGRLVTQDGMAVLGRRGPIELRGKGAVYISPEGRIVQGGTEIDTLKMAAFDRPEDLSKVGNSLYTNDDARQVARKASAFKLQQGYLEGSNVNVIEGLTELITLSRQFETYQKMLSMFSEIEKLTVQQVGHSV